MIKDGYFVSCTYKLYNASSKEHEMIEHAPEAAPLQFIFGQGTMLDKFEENIAGLKTGDHFDFTLEPKDAYGEIVSEMIMDLDKSIFVDPNGNFDAETVTEGNLVPMQTVDGQIVNGFVSKVGEDKVTIDFNHQMAGLALHFEGKIIDAHKATAEDELYIKNLYSGGCGCGCGTEEQSGGCGGCCGCS